MDKWTPKQIEESLRNRAATQRELQAQTREQFLADVRNHQLKVFLNTGEHLHLQFANPATSNQWFEILAWPGALAMSGDMGSWLFRRERDMVRFFRTTTGEINPRYWHEKLEAVDRHGAQEFDADVFRADALALLDNFGLDEKEMATERELLEDHLRAYDFQAELQESLVGWRTNKVSFEAEDLPSGLVWKHRFLWACHAIVWAIEMYDRRDIACR